LENGDMLWDAANSLLSFPGKERMGRIKGSFELVIAHTPYIIAYRIEPEAIRIMRILRGARRWPRRMSKL
jgi:toxin ParE1/3/4